MSTSLKSLIKEGKAIKKDSAISTIQLKDNQTGEFGAEIELSPSISYDTYRRDPGQSIIKPNVTDQLLNIVNQQENPNGRYLFAVGIAQNYHSTFAVVDNKDPENPKFTFIDNHGALEFSKQGFDKKISGYLGGALRTYTRPDGPDSPERLLKNISMRTNIYLLKP